MRIKNWQISFFFTLVLSGIAGCAGCDGDIKPVVLALDQLAFHEKLADRWAPIHYQDVDQTGDGSMGGKADYITNIDFDGEWDTLNNWKSAKTSPLKAYVYYSIVATKTHWFIIYAFYHPRDWANVNIGNLHHHENDMEGFLAIIKRPTNFSKDDLGKLVGIITVFHLDFYSYIPLDSPLQDGKEDIDGWLGMGSFDGNSLMRPITAQEARGHGLKAYPYVEIKGGDGLRYLPRDFPGQPAGPNDRTVGYKLVDIFRSNGMWKQHELWLSQGTSNITFASYGTFRGNDGKDNAAHAPWKWDDEDDGSSLQGGELAVDPAKIVGIYFDNLGPFNYAYTFNQYRNILCAWPDEC